MYDYDPAYEAYQQSLEEPLTVQCQKWDCPEKGGEEQKVVETRVTNTKVDPTEMYKLEKCGHWVMAG